MDYTPDAPGPDLTNGGSGNLSDLVEEKGPGSLGADSPYEGQTGLPGDPMGTGLDDLGRGAPDVGPGGLAGDPLSAFGDPLAGSQGPGGNSLEGSNAAGGLPDWMGSVGDMMKKNNTEAMGEKLAKDLDDLDRGSGGGTPDGGATDGGTLTNPEHLAEAVAGTADKPPLGPNNVQPQYTPKQLDTLRAKIATAKAETPKGEKTDVNVDGQTYTVVGTKPDVEGDSAGQPAEPDVDPETEAAWRDYGEDKSNYMQIKFDSLQNDDMIRDPLATDTGGTTPYYDGTDYGPDGKPEFGSGGGAEISPEDIIDCGPDDTGDAASGGPDTDQVGEGPPRPRFWLDRKRRGRPRRVARRRAT